MRETAGVDWEHISTWLLAGLAFGGGLGAGLVFAIWLAVVRDIFWRWK